MDRIQTLPVPLGVREGEFLTLERLDREVACFHSMAHDVDAIASDYERELRFRLRPAFLMDYSEIHYVLHSLPSIRGRTPEPSGADFLVDSVIRVHESTDIYLPPGTVFELVGRMCTDLNLRPPKFALDLRSFVRQPDAHSGLTRLPTIATLFEKLPTAGDIEKAVASADAPISVLTGYRELVSLIRERRIRFLHDEPWGSIGKWDEGLFRELLAAFVSRRPRADSQNLYDAMNYAWTIAVNRNCLESHRVCYLVGRGHYLHDVAHRMPWQRDPAVRFQGSVPTGAARTPIYLYLRKSALRPDATKSLDHLQYLLRHLRAVRANYSLLAGSIQPRHDGGRPAGFTLDPTRNQLHLEVVQAQKRFSAGVPEELALPLFHVWDVVRRNFTSERQRLPPSPPPRIVDHEPPQSADALDLLSAAHRARQALSRIVSPDSGLATLSVSHTKHVVEGVAQHVYVLVAVPDGIPILYLQFHADYCSAHWYSSVDIHSLLDWVDDYVGLLDRYSAGNDVQLERQRRINSTFFTTRRVPAPVEAAETENVIGLPLATSDRFRVVRTFGPETEAIRLYTPYGDFWANFTLVDDVGGVEGIRTGFVSHLNAPAFLAHFVAATAVAAPQLLVLFDHLEPILTRHLGPLPSGKPSAENG